MAKEKLTQNQYLQLKGLNLQEKLALLSLWKKNCQITQKQFNYFSNLWINRETKKIIDIRQPLRRSAGENRGPYCRSVVEGEINVFINNLQSKLNEYLTSRDNMLLSMAEINRFADYLNQNGCYRSLINRLLVIGLRYPDKRLNKIAEEFISQRRKYPGYPDIHFWSLLWEDCNLVPMDAVRLMLIKKGKDQSGKELYAIDPCFSRELISDLIPMIEIQRDKENERLKFAQSLEGRERDREVERKIRRRNAFNILLAAAEEYVRK